MPREREDAAGGGKRTAQTGAPWKCFEKEESVHRIKVFTEVRQVCPPG